MKIAVLSAVQENNYLATIRCLLEMEYIPIQLSPTDENLFEKLNECPYLIIQAHSSDFRLFFRLRKNGYQGEIINYWRGSDVYNTFGNIRRYLDIKIAQWFVDKNWAVGKRLVSELKRLQIDAKNVPSYIYHPPITTKQAYKKAAVVYYPIVSGRNDMSSSELYGIDPILEIIEKMPDFKFYFVGGGELPIHAHRENIVISGILDNMKPMWEQVDYYLRISRSDGMPKMILEALENNVMPLTNYPYFENIWLHQDATLTSRRMRDYQNYKHDMLVLQREVDNQYGIDAVQKIYSAELVPSENSL